MKAVGIILASAGAIAGRSAPAVQQGGCRRPARSLRKPKKTLDRTGVRSTSSTPLPAIDPRSPLAELPKSRCDFAASWLTLHLQPKISVLRSPIETTDLSGRLARCSAFPRTDAPLTSRLSAEDTMPAEAEEQLFAILRGGHVEYPAVDRTQHLAEFAAPLGEGLVVGGEHGSIDGEHEVLPGL